MVGRKSRDDHGAKHSQAFQRETHTRQFGGSGIKKVFVCRAGPYGVGAGGVVGTSGSLSSSLGAKSEACDGRGSTFRQTFF